MEFALGAIAIIVVGVAVYYNRKIKSFDTNQDGKVDRKDAIVIVDNVVSGVKTDLDVNQDGQVDIKDVKATAAKIKKAVKKPAVKKAAARKPRTGSAKS